MTKTKQANDQNEKCTFSRLTIHHNNVQVMTTLQGSVARASTSRVYVDQQGETDKAVGKHTQTPESTQPGQWLRPKTEENSISM